jgi:hypothetical protein
MKRVAVPERGWFDAEQACSFYAEGEAERLYLTRLGNWVLWTQYGGYRVVDRDYAATWLAPNALSPEDVDDGNNLTVAQREELRSVAPQIAAKEL